MARTAEKITAPVGTCRRGDGREGSEEQPRPAGNAGAFVLVGGGVVEPREGHDQTAQGAEDGDEDDQVHHPAARFSEGRARHAPWPPPKGRRAWPRAAPPAGRRSSPPGRGAVTQATPEPQAAGQVPAGFLDLARHMAHVHPAVVGEEHDGDPEPDEPEEAEEARAPSGAAESAAVARGGEQEASAHQGQEPQDLEGGQDDLGAAPPLRLRAG